MKSRSGGAFAPALPKAPTGIVGLDEITLGGLPRGRPSLVCGTAGDRRGADGAQRRAARTSSAISSASSAVAATMPL